MNYPYVFTRQEVNLIRDILKSWDGWIAPCERCMTQEEEKIYDTLLDRFKEQV